MTRRISNVATALVCGWLNCAAVVLAGEPDWQPRHALLLGHERPPSEVAFSPDGRLLMTSDVSGDRAVLWEVGPPLRAHSAISFTNGSSWPVGFSPDGRRLICLSNRGSHEITSRDLATGESRVFGEWAPPVRISPDGRWLLAGLPQGIKSVNVYDLRAETKLGTFELGDSEFTPGGIRDAVFGHDGNSLTVLFNGRPAVKAQSWELPSGQSRPAVTFPEPAPWKIAVDPHGKTLRIGQVNAEDVAGITPDRWVRSMTYAMIGKAMAVLTENSLTVRDYPTGRILANCPVDSQFNPGAVTFSRDGTRVAATNLRGPVVLDLETGRASTIHRRAGDLRSLAFNADDSWLAAARGNFVELWEMTSPENPIVLSGPMPLVESVAFHPSSPVLAAGSVDGSVRLWNLTTREHRVLSGHTRSVPSLAFHPDGKTLVTGSIDGTIKVWDVTTERELTTMTAGGAVRSVAVSPDGRTLAAGTHAPSIELWNVETAGRIGSLSGHTAPVMSVSFSPNGQSLVSTSTDKSLRVWNVSDQACVRVIRDLNIDFLTAAHARGVRRIASVDSLGRTTLWTTDGTPLTQTRNTWSYRGTARPQQHAVFAVNRAGTIIASARSDEAIGIYDIPAVEK